MATKGLVRIGEGRKDDAPGIFTDEKLGSWRDRSVPAAIALDPACPIEHDKLFNFFYTGTRESL